MFINIFIIFVAHIFLLKFEVDGARYKRSCEGDTNMYIRFGVNMESIQLTQDGLQATPVVNTEKKLNFLDGGEFFYSMHYFHVSIKDPGA
jgi:hypothetical protein